jgi:DNA-binding transcriptional ArsR family regulator
LTTTTGFADYVDHQLAKAIAHPMRAQIVAEIGGLRGGHMSAKQFADRHDLDVSSVSGHFRYLEKLDVIEEVGSRPVRGATEHFYRAKRKALFDGKDWANLPPSIQEAISHRTMSNLFGEVTEAVEEETFDARNDRALAWDKMVLDTEGWNKVVGIFRDAIFQTIEAGEESKERISAHPDRRGVPAAWAFLFFTAPRPKPDEAHLAGLDPGDLDP